MSAREKLRAFVEHLADDRVEAALRMLEESDPMLAALLNAPEDDEPLTEEERLAVEQAIQEAERGELIPWEQLRDELG